MRHLVLSLALLSACAGLAPDAPDAPSVDQDLTQRTVTGRLDVLEQQLNVATTTIKSLQA